MSDTRKPVHVMLDIETLGTKPGSMIAAIGACTFAHPGERRTLYATASLRSQDGTMKIDVDTVLWWLRQDQAARAALLAAQDDREKTGDLWCALDDLATFLAEQRGPGEAGPLRIWCNGASFDAPLLEAAMAAEEMERLWKYSEIRCHRTLLDLAGVDGKAFRPAIAHHALHDALAQADAAEAAFRKLGLLPPAEG